jgi:pimeloyl-ACP methyl ester carboxylesterase
MVRNSVNEGFAMKSQVKSSSIGGAPVKTLVGLVVVAAIVVVSYSLTTTETKVLDERTRAELGGEYVKLSDGVVHYAFAGNEDAPAVVFVHGFSTPSFIWDQNINAVTEAGYSALRYDLYGRGYSDRPRGIDYNADLFVRQLSELIEAVGIATPVTLVGVSMGGAISVIFAERHPELVRALVLVDPAGFPLEMPLTSKLVQIPVLGEYLMRMVGGKAARDSIAKNFYDPSLVPDFTKKFEVQMEYVGFQAALLSTLRHMPLQDLEASYRKVGEVGMPVLLVWGKQDELIPFETSERVKTAIPQAELLAIDQAAHAPNYEKPEVVNPAILGFLGRVAPL